MQVGEIEVEIVRKNIRNVHLAVLPPDGKVRVATPLLVDDDSVRRLVIGRLSWIHAQQAKFENQERQPLRQYVDGETHYFRGQRYRLEVREITTGSNRIELRGNAYLTMYVRPNSDVVARGRVLQTWYREQLKNQLPALAAKWEPRIGVQAQDWQVKLMKTKWGTCNIEARRIWLNLELAKVAPHLLEYVVVHELIHLLERTHNERFRGLLDQFMPNWRLHREALNGGELAAYESFDLG
ncbi:metal-dependent hydrolase [Hymenobacter qilianensis]|uniref:Metal-dependent hydrolase n=1 Tax=Hymenobacter qilianensis TaxID=1385715 RepID=A0ACB5PRC6_9BACT|nr:SprT family zinc-dependent metalloprotease [Hymenobacter qilianensis]GGF64290.1 metal-dependent hydrolase [Hymenobacter qilianensis]